MIQGTSLLSNSRINVVICKGGFLRVDGSGEILVNYALHLKANGHGVRVLLATAFDSDNKHYQRLNDAGIPVDCVVRHPLYQLLRVLRKIDGARSQLFGSSQLDWERMAYLTSRFYFQSHRTDVVHMIQADATAPGMISAAHAARIPVLYQEMITPRYGPGSDILYDRLADVLHLCAGVTALSPIQATEVRERVPYDGNVSVLPLICDTPVIKACTTRVNETTFGFAARLEHWKGPLVLLEACALLLQNCRNVYLRMAGTGPQEQEAIARAKALLLGDHCEFVGSYAGPEERSAFMRSLDVFVQPSFADGTPNSIIEAMAHGLPIVASLNGGIPDLVSSDVGILVPPGDATALADALARLASDQNLRERMGRAARDRYEKLFSPDAVLPVLLGTYRDVIEKSGNTAGISSASAVQTHHPWVSFSG